MKNMELVTNVNLAKKDSHSLRITIPEAIAHYLNLEPGDKVNWVMEISRGKKVAIVRRVTND